MESFAEIKNEKSVVLQRRRKRCATSAAIKGFIIKILFSGNSFIFVRP